MAEIEVEGSCGKGSDEGAGRYGNDVVLNVDDVSWETSDKKKVEDLWLKSMDMKVASKDSQVPPPFTICRVPQEIRKVDSGAYEPMVVSIGPYHRGNPKLHDMEEVKWRILSQFRLRARDNFMECLKTMKEIEPKARQCYSGKINMEVNEFIEMMLLDGLFIIQYLVRTIHPLGAMHIKDVDPIFTIRGMLDRVGEDMLLLENQLPFFVLETLWKLIGLIGQHETLDLSCYACGFIKNCFNMQFEHELDDKLLSEKIITNEKLEPVNVVHHLLHLAVLFLKPTSLTPPTSSTRKFQCMKCTAKFPAVEIFLRSRCQWFPLPSCKKSSSMECIAELTEATKKTLHFPHPRCHCFPSPSGQESSFKSENELPRPRLRPIPSATELHEAGVKFQCVQAKSFLDIKFEQGTMKIPHLAVHDSTKSLFRNFIALEQCFPASGDDLTTYCIFMDYLVDTPRDVQILKHSDIIESLLGGDEEVALLFNKLCNGIIWDINENYLSKLVEEVTIRTQETWPKWRAKLVRDYFSSPWSIISCIAATCIVFLAFAQTYCAAFT